MTKKSLTFRFLQKAGLNYSEGEYGKVSFFHVFKKTFTNYKNAILHKLAKNSILFTPINPRFLRPKLWRMIGCKVGKGCFIGSNVSIDTGNAALITLEDNVHIAGHCILLCHQRKMEDYFVGGDYSKLGYHRKPIVIRKGVLIGTDCLIMPGVEIGEGSIIGAGSLITKSIPAWVVATGRPAKPVRDIKHPTLT